MVKYKARSFQKIITYTKWQISDPTTEAQKNARLIISPEKFRSQKNERIRAPKIRVIGPDGKQLGIMTPYEALAIARRNGLDLLEVSPTAEPPVCRILDYGKYMYEESKNKSRTSR